MDYKETFAPVAKMNTIRNLMSLAVNLNWKLKQYNIKNAFLHGVLDEKVYMTPPQGFDKNYGKNKLCKLKALYEMKQSCTA